MDGCKYISLWYMEPETRAGILDPVQHLAANTALESKASKVEAQGMTMTMWRWGGIESAAVAEHSPRNAARYRRYLGVIPIQSIQGPF